MKFSVGSEDTSNQCRGPCYVINGFMELAIRRKEVECAVLYLMLNSIPILHIYIYKDEDVPFTYTMGIQLLLISLLHSFFLICTVARKLTKEHIIAFRKFSCSLANYQHHPKMA